MASHWDDEADVVIVDEVSMVGLVLMARLMEGLRPDTRLILLGDKDQLPSVDAGAALAHLIPGSGDRGPVKRWRPLEDAVILLRTNHRSEPRLRFIHELGGEVEICPPGATFPSLPGAETMIRYRVKASESERGGESLWNLLAHNVDARNIRIHRQTAVTRLVRSEDEIVGVEADREGRRISIAARRAVVLTTGGFEYNEEMKREYLAGYPIHAYGHRGNTGDGIKLAQDVGADLWHMKSVAAPMGFKFPEYESAFIMRMPADGYIIVDQNGRRHTADREGRRNDSVDC